MSKTLAQKFFLKPDNRIYIGNAPKDFVSQQLTDLPQNITFVETLGESPNIIIQFSTTMDQLNSLIPRLIAVMNIDMYVWIGYPKGGKKAAIPTDLNRDIIWDAFKNAGFKAVHIITIDETWSAIRFRLETESKDK